MTDKKTHRERGFVPIRIALMTVTDSRTEETDTSGHLLAERLQEAGHALGDKAVVPHVVDRIREQMTTWIADPSIQAIICNGGTGITPADVIPQVIKPLLDVEMEGFGELFRWLSYQDIGSSTIQSRAIGGIAKGTVVFCLPGSPGACRLGWDEIISHQFDNRNRPCNLVEILPLLTPQRRG